jgi:hypothetical protein
VDGEWKKLMPEEKRRGRKWGNVEKVDDELNNSEEKRRRLRGFRRS